MATRSASISCARAEKIFGILVASGCCAPARYQNARYKTMKITKLTLHPTPPFDFDKTLDFLEGFSPTRDEQSLAARVLTKAILVAGQVVVFQVQSSGAVAAPQLDCALYSAQPIA